ncbi:MAG: hypothetical protein D6719_12245 [Candidatus Dadabacteria bacterium]|nr:MAG: hypothetical protein D6719_12245 [Candidatus Dadabacteria bacterium]
MKFRRYSFFLGALMFFFLAAGSLQAQVIFKLTVKNLTDYEISPGGYVVHDSSFQLYRTGQPAPSSIKSLCESGHTMDFLYYVRRKKAGIRNAFSFAGGLPPKGEASILFKASRRYPLLSFAHKISFTDDTCTGTNNLQLFDSDFSPLKSVIKVKAFDAGTLKNIKLFPPKSRILAQFNWNYWKEYELNPPEPIAASPIFNDRDILQVIVEPYKYKP